MKIDLDLGTIEDFNVSLEDAITKEVMYFARERVREVLDRHKEVMNAALEVRLKTILDNTITDIQKMELEDLVENMDIRDVMQKRA